MSKLKCRIFFFVLGSERSVVRYKSADVSEECIASILIVLRVRQTRSRVRVLSLKIEALCSSGT
jgi:hypothetical protein